MKGHNLREQSLNSWGNQNYLQLPFVLTNIAFSDDMCKLLIEMAYITCWVQIKLLSAYMLYHKQFTHSPLASTQ